MRVRNRRTQWYIVAAGLALLLMLAITTIVVVVGFSALGTDTDNVSRASIETLGQIRLPATANNLHAHLQKWQDYSIRIRFDLPAADVNELLKTAICRELKDTEAPSEFRFGIKRDWWQPLKASRFKAGRESKGNLCQSILIDESGPGTSIVYVVTFST